MFQGAQPSNLMVTAAYPGLDWVSDKRLVRLATGMWVLSSLFGLTYNPWLGWADGWNGL